MTILSRVSIGDSVSQSSSPSRLILLGTCAAATAATICWLLCLRDGRQRASKEEVLSAVEILKAECASAYAEVAGSLRRASPLPASVAASIEAAAAAAAAAAACRTEHSAADQEAKPHDAAAKLRAAAEQPLVLGAALTGAAERASKVLPDCEEGDAEALDEELARYEGELEIQEATLALAKLHEACLSAKPDLDLFQESIPEALWTADELLQMLEMLAQGKKNALTRALAHAAAASRPVQEMGGNVVEACAAAEDLIWEQRWPNDTLRRSSFSAALAAKAKDPDFQARKAILDMELQASVMGVAAAAAHRVIAAF